MLDNKKISTTPLRNQIFWFADGLNRSIFKQNYDDIKFAFKEPTRFLNSTEFYLSHILEHAVKTTRFYKSFDGYSSLADFPVIPKEKIKDQYNLFLSDRYKNEKLFTRSTSGSYGVPFTIHFTKQKLKRQRAEVLYFNHQAGYQLGEPFIQIRIHPKSKFSLFLQNSVMLIPNSISKEWLQMGRDILLKKSHKFMVTYPASLLPLAKFCKDMGDTPDMFALENIVTSAEMITDSMRNTFHSVFGSKIHDRYATLETGILAHECPDCGYYHVNFPSYHLELLKLDRDEPVSKGEPGRVVVTDYYSHAVPIIRYDIGDIAQWITGNGICDPVLPTLKKIIGRKDDFVQSVDGTYISPPAIFEAIAFQDFSNYVFQYQFIQLTKDRYRLLVVPVSDNDFKYEGLLLSGLKKLLGQNSHIDIIYLDEIPPLSSGKRPVVINKYKKNAGD